MLFMFVWKRLENQCWITVTLEDSDDSYCGFHFSLNHPAKSDLHGPLHRLDDVVVGEETRMDAGQGVVN